MSDTNPLTKAIDLVGLAALARGLDVTYPAIRKWEARGRLPRTEWTGETDYSGRIEVLTGGAVTRADLLAKWPELAATPVSTIQQGA